VKQKLYAQQGATITAALLFFLVAAVCGSIILGAATATLSRVKNQAKDTQAYYAVTSAAQLIRDDLMNSRWLITLEDTYTVEEGAETVTPSITSIQLVDKDLKPLSADEINKTFVRDLYVATAALNSSLVTTNTITITAPSVTGFPTVFAQAEALPLTGTIGDQTSELKIMITNNKDDEGGRFTNFKERDTEGNQLYWVKVSLRSVKYPAGYQILTDGRDESGKRIVRRTVCLGWDDPVIEKVNVA